MSGDPSKSRLLEAAGREFAEKGFEGASIRSICRRAEMNGAAVNYHFGDKEQLYVEAVIEAHRCGRSPLMADDRIFEGPPAEQLRRAIRDMVESMTSGDPLGWHDALMFREMIRPTLASNALASQVIRPKFDRLRALIRELAPGSDDRRVDAIAFSVVGQCLFYKVGRPIAERLIGDEAIAAMDVEFLSDHIAGVILAAIGQGPPIGGAVQAQPKPKASRS